MTPTMTGDMRILPTTLDSDEQRRVLEIADTPEARKWKVKLAAGYRLLSKYGLDQGIAGHVSARVPGAPDYFWVNPFGLQFSQITADQLALVSHRGELIGGWPLVNYAAFCIHGAIHQARPDVDCAVHTHSPAGSAFSALNIPLEPLDQVCCSFFEDHAVYSEYDGVVADLDQTRGIVEALGDNRALILANHGLVTCAKTIEQAIIDMIDFDRSCKINLLAMSTGRTLQRVPPEAARQARQMQIVPTRWPFQWPNLIIELNQQTQDYDPHGWLPSDEVPTAERLREALERGRVGQP
ncbi:MAG: class II aldolase/adducin family protein [Pirellulaceae bacterium]|nr:class II aldolase/adducin family protein [Pirellulaceae bacterium]